MIHLQYFRKKKTHFLLICEKQHILDKSTLCDVTKGGATAESPVSSTLKLLST